MTLIRIGRLSEALDLAYICASLRKEALGENHPDYINSLNDIGLALYELGKFE